MSNEQSASFANRDTPIPVVSITGPDASAGRTPNAQDGTKHHLSAGKLKEKLQSLGDDIGRSESPSRVSDRLLTMYIYSSSTLHQSHD
jgi:hypothetical protein